MLRRFNRSKSRYYSADDSGASLGELDRGLLTGVLVSFGFISVAVATSGEALSFLDIHSALIVFGGTIGATLVHFSIADLLAGIKAARQALLTREERSGARMQQLIGLASVVRSDGLLALESESRRVSDPFLHLALELTADSTAAEDVRRILETEMRASAERAARGVQLFQTMGNYAPALGLIGTLIGLIQMLGHLQDSASVGPAMAIALVATLYGSITANLVCFPLAGKLKHRAEEDLLVKSITVEGVLALGRQENPLMLEQRLQSFQPLGRAA